jgi:cell division protein FtsZ
MLVKPQGNNFAKIKVVGVGGGGNNAVNNMIANYNIDGVEFIGVNTDAQALAQSNSEVKIRIGEDITRGLGSGGNPTIGKKAAEESIDMLHEHLAGADMVFVTAGMGGGTGTGASPIIAGVAKNLGALTVGIVTKPFNFEGKRRIETAIKGIDELRDKVDTLIVVPNQKLLDVIDKNISFLDAMKQVDDVLSHAVRSIAHLITQAGLINVDFADVKSVMENAGTALMGMGTSKGENRAKMAAQLAVSSPLLEVSIDGAKGVLFNVIGGPDLAMFEIDEAAQFISDSVDSEANIIFGATIDPDKTEEIEITVLATGFDTTSEKAILENRTDELGLGRKQEPQVTGLGGIPAKEEPQQASQETHTAQHNSQPQPQAATGDDASGGIDINFTKRQSDNRPGRGKDTSITDEEESDLETPSFLRRKDY